MRGVASGEPEVDVVIASMSIDTLTFPERRAGLAAMLEAEAMPPQVVALA